MGCKAGYPKEPCPFGFDGKVTRTSCGACKNFEPPPHILAWCALYDREGTICKLPKSACGSCVDKVARGPGRPPGEGEVDWKDSKSVALYMKNWRAKNALFLKQKRAKFLKKHPKYFEKYRKKNRTKINALARKRYAEGKDESSAEEV
jgi:hypothetical protein